MARGGMRYGAGRPGHKIKNNQCLSLDVRRLKRAGMLAEGADRAWVWRNSETGERTASIGCNVAHGRLALDFTCNGAPIAQRVGLTRTACHKGGARAWFVCPCCERRVAVLFFRWKRFACRHCNQVAYRSQSEDACGRAWLRQSRIEEKLGPDWQRPKHMHHATYERLWQAVVDCEQVRDEWIAGMVSRLLPGGMNSLA